MDDEILEIDHVTIIVSKTAVNIEDYPGFN